MNITGIVVEYNPFHNGHIRHINEAKKLTNCDLLIAITSGSFSQRGDISVLDKFEKTKLALEHGIDLVVELPYVYTCQNARVFGDKALEILKKLNINNIVFGSETCNEEELKKYAELNIDITKLKEIMSSGTSYPKAYGLLASSLYPNDILAVSYLKAIKNTDIKAFPIQRTSNFHDNKIAEICSASAIRNAIKNNEDYSIGTPASILEAHFNDELYPYLRRLLFTHDKKDLQEIFLVSEGIEGLLIKNAFMYSDYDDFINASVSRRYTKSRIQRIILNIMLQIKKKDVDNKAELNSIRILGFNAKGQEFLRNYENEDIKLITQFKNMPDDYKKIEWKVAQLYASLRENPEAYLKKELKGPVILK